MTPNMAPRLVGFAILFIIFLIVGASTTYIVQPGHRGVTVTLGKVSPAFKPEGFGLKLPLITSVLQVDARQQTRAVTAECFSSDLQHLKMELRLLYRIPEQSVVNIHEIPA